MSLLSKRSSVPVFLVFAFAYFLSTFISATTAALTPVLSREFTLQASDLGLLAGGYFLGFAITQLPLGKWLDRYGPKRVIVCFLVLAILGCIAFAHAHTFTGLLAARVLSGAGLSACLMAPLTGYRRWFAPAVQMRSNAWMLMTGSLGMIASTLPVQWLVPVVGWRPMFMVLAILFLLAATLIAWRAPAWTGPQLSAGLKPSPSGYAVVWRHPYFRAMAPVGFFCYGGLLAVQTLWAAPWMVKVAGYSALQAATGMFWLNVAMLFTFWCWGLVSPSLARRGLNANRLMTLGLPASFALLAIVIVVGDRYPASTGALLALYCMACTFISPSQPAVGMAFSPEVAGRALSAYNLVIFAGVFAIQWGIGLMIDGLMALGASQMQSFRLAFAVFLSCCIASFVHFKRATGHNPSPTTS